jgi:hypothetical protein
LVTARLAASLAAAMTTAEALGMPLQRECSSVCFPSVNSFSMNLGSLRSDPVLTTILFRFVIHDADLNVPAATPQQSQRIVTALLFFFPQERYGFLKV